MSMHSCGLGDELSQYVALVAKHCARAVLAVIVLILSACSASSQVTLSDEAARQPATEDASASATESDDVVATAPVASNDLADVFADVAEAIVFIDTPDGTGTGVVIEGGWIVTNAHNVDRWPTARIGASDGTDLGEHPVLGVDWLVDLALVGPIDDPAVSQLARSSSADARVGDTVLLVGYPDESNFAPTPTLTVGVISRRRQASIGDLRFIQTDATIAPGQSGGALLDLQGNLLGITGLQFGGGEFGMAFETDALWPRVDRLIENPTVALPTGTPVFTDTAEISTLRNYGAVLEVDESGLLTVLVTSEDDIWFEIQTLGGSRLFDEPDPSDVFNPSPDIVLREFYVDDLLEGGEELNATIEPGTYQLVVGSFGGDASEITVSTNSEMWPHIDDEEGALLPIGELVEGEIDYTGDSDRWQLELTAGEPVTITSDGISDPVVVVRLDGELVATSDDEGIGIFGTGARLTFTPDVTATYEVEVATFDSTRWAYLILVE